MNDSETKLAEDRFFFCFDYRLVDKNDLFSFRIFIRSLGIREKHVIFIPKRKSSISSECHRVCDENIVQVTKNNKRAVKKRLFFLLINTFFMS